MDKSCIITLLSHTYTKDSIGQQIETETRKDVYAKIGSVTGTEWHNAGKNNINPSYRFVMFLYDYNDEEVIEYNGQRYGVYRTYMTDNDMIELYVQKKAGV